MQPSCAAVNLFPNLELASAPPARSRGKLLSSEAGMRQFIVIRMGPTLVIKFRESDPHSGHGTLPEGSYRSSGRKVPQPTQETTRSVITPPTTSGPSTLGITGGRPRTVAGLGHCRALRHGGGSPRQNVRIRATSRPLAKSASISASDTPCFRHFARLPSSQPNPGIISSIGRCHTNVCTGAG